MTRNMNAVIRASRRKYVVKVDADDILEPNYVSSRMPVIEAHPREIFAHYACASSTRMANYPGISP